MEHQNSSTDKDEMLQAIFSELYTKLHKDLGTADFNCINDMLALQKTKSILMKKSGVHDVLQKRLEKLIDEDEILKVKFVEEYTQHYEKINNNH